MIIIEEIEKMHVNEHKSDFIGLKIKSSFEYQQKFHSNETSLPR